MYTVYQLRARVGPFECTSYRRFSDFLRLQQRLKAAAKERAREESSGEGGGGGSNGGGGGGSYKVYKSQLVAATPTAGKLRESKNISLIASRRKMVEQRLRLIQRYCTELCASQELAQHELVTSFFWPNDGTGSVVAPDGSSASMT